VVQGRGQNAVGREKGLLDAVAVVDVGVEVQDALKARCLEELQDREDAVVDEAEAGGARAARMVPPALPVRGDLRAPADQRGGGRERAAGGQLGVLGEAGEGRALAVEAVLDPRALGQRGGRGEGGEVCDFILGSGR
jgi:hypothetical protein